VGGLTKEARRRAEQAAAARTTRLLEPITDAAYRLGTTVSEVRNLARKGKLEAVRLGRRDMIVSESTDRLVAELRGFTAN